MSPINDYTLSRLSIEDKA